MNKPIIPWNPFGRKPLPRRFPVPRPHAKKRRKIIPWNGEDWHVVRGDTVRTIKPFFAHINQSFIDLKVNIENGQSRMHGHVRKFKIIM